jgi:hypothetical protein
MKAGMSLIIAATLGLFVLCPEALAASDSNLVAHWQFDEGSGTIAYDSAGNNDGTIYGAQWTTGIIGGALDFDGINDYVEVPDNESQQIKTNQLTVMAWIKLDEDIGNRQRRLICKQEPSGIYWTLWALAVCGKGYSGCTGNQVVFNDSNGSTFSVCLSPTNLALHQWHHIAVTDTAGAIRIYLDGQLDHSCDNGYGIPSNINAPIHIGCTNLPQLFFKNMVDDAMIFDRALSAEEILQIYEEAFPPEIPTAYYVDGVKGNDDNNGLTLQTAFATVQKGINTAKDSNTVLVYPAVYSEAVDFLGKAITVQGVATTAGIPVLEKVGDFAVSFYNGEEPNSILKNFVIKNSFMAAFISGCSPTISNVTVVDNKYGIAAYTGGQPDISNCIFWNNTDADLIGCQARYSWVQDTKPQPLEGLISRWELDEGSGTIAHDSAGNNDGTIHGALWTSGILGGALNFDGINDYVEVPNNESQQIKTNQLTVAGWIKLDEDVGNRQRRIICKFQTGLVCWGLSVCGNGHYGCTGNQVLFFDSDGQTTWYNCLSTTKLALHKWYHIAVTDTAGVIRIYLDGQLDHSCGGGYGIPPNINAPIHIGCTNPPQLFFKNMVDDAMIFDRALSAEEIRQLFDGGLTDNPLFADPANGDYHLRSRRGRYWPQHDVWVLDKVTSPCIDGGDPAVDPSGEPMPNGGRIDMGAYGGTPFASMSEWPITTDTNRDGVVDFADLATFCNEWLSTLPWAE